MEGGPRVAEVASKEDGDWVGQASAEDGDHISQASAEDGGRVGQASTEDGGRVGQASAEERADGDGVGQVGGRNRRLG